MPRLALVLAAIALAAAAACKSDGGAKWVPPETICAPGELKCFGNYLGTCDDTGKQWNMVSCGASQYCEARACRTRACAPGTGGCDDDASGWRCNANGSARDPLSCKDKEECHDGLCLAIPCGAGDVRCPFDATWTCTGGGWEVAKCPDGQMCGTKPDGEQACVARACAPDETRCGSPTVAGTCNATGTDFLVQPCGEHELCVEPPGGGGFCLPEVANPPPKPEPTPDVPVKDHGGGDPAGDKLPEEPREDLPQIEAIIPGENKATINGVEVRFLDLHDADWISAEGMLMINLISKKADVPDTLPAAKHNLEIRIAGIVEGQVGTFKCEDVSSYTTQFWHRYGKYPQGETCKDFDYEAASCTVTIEEFGPADGGSVAGTFTDVQLVDCQQDGTTISITNGVFDVER
ncbi:MAG: hypothetical protein FJ087_09800 [Deltaproteobacteria bacterium]|nr:hypothetical protein [Deltaproteobacteria bacterium]